MSVNQDQLPDNVSPAGSYQSLVELSGKEFHDTWLAMQCGLVAGAYLGVLVKRKEGSDSFQPVAIWPEPAADIEIVTELIEQVIEQQCGLISTLDNKPSYGMAYPIIIDKEINAIVAVAARISDNKTLKYSMRQLEWGCAWIALQEKNELARTTGQDKDRLAKSVELLAGVLAEQTADAAALRLVSELATLFICDRVSIGFLENKAIKVQQVSHSAQFGRRMNLIRAIEAAMEESVDQLSSISLPELEQNKNSIVVAHQALVEQESENCVLSIPLFVNQDAVGAITMERELNKPFSEEDLSYCESICSICASTLIEKRKNDRLLIYKTSDSIKEQLSKLFGPGRLLLKCSVLILLAVVVFFSIATGTYNLSADAKLKGAMQRAIVAPYDGYIDSTHARAGDRVVEDDVLVTLDIRDFSLERLKWLSQMEKLKRQRQEMLAERDRAGLNVLTAQLEQAQIQLELVEMQIQRAVLQAPFNGTVVSGDLSQRLGGTVMQGELLFELSPVDDYRIDIKVKETRMADIQVGQNGLLYLSALPEQPYEFTIIRITPVTISENKQTFFMVEGKLLQLEQKFQIGMEGVAQIEIDERKIISIWTRDFIDWIRLQFWSLSS